MSNPFVEESWGSSPGGWTVGPDLVVVQTTVVTADWVEAPAASSGMEMAMDPGPLTSNGGHDAAGGGGSGAPSYGSGSPAGLGGPSDPDPWGPAGTALMAASAGGSGAVSSALAALVTVANPSPGYPGAAPSGTTGAAPSATTFSPAIVVSLPSYTVTISPARPGNSPDPVRGDHDPAASSSHAITTTNDVSGSAAGGDAGSLAALLSTAPGNAGAVSVLASGIPVAAVPMGLGGPTADGRAIFDGKAPLLSATDLGGAFSPGRSEGPAPLGPIAVGGSPGSRSRRNDAQAAAGLTLPGPGTPAPQRSDLLTDFKPFDRSALETAIDRFLAQFDDLGSGLSSTHGPDDLLKELLAVSVAFAAAKVGLRLFWRPREEEPGLADTDISVHFDAYPGLLDP